MAAPLLEPSTSMGTGPDMETPLIKLHTLDNPDPEPVEWVENKPEEATSETTNTGNDAGTDPK